MRTQLIAVSLILLLISTGIESYRIQKRETPTYLTHASDALNTAWGHVSGKTQELIEKARSTGVEDKIKEYYDKSTTAISTYFNVLSDQAYHWWNGN